MADKIDASLWQDFKSDALLDEVSGDDLEKRVEQVVDLEHRQDGRADREPEPPAELSCRVTRCKVKK